MLNIKNLKVGLAEEDKQILKGVDLNIGEGEVHAKICLIFKIISTVSLFPLLIKNDGTMQFLTKCIIRNTN